ncbi:MAG: hypothetical protein WCY93_07740 [Anaerolineaceae bacterium]
MSANNIMILLLDSLEWLWNWENVTAAVLVEDIIDNNDVSRTEVELVLAEAISLGYIVLDENMNLILSSSGVDLLDKTS